MHYGHIILPKGYKPDNFESQNSLKFNITITGCSKKKGDLFWTFASRACFKYFEHLPQEHALNFKHPKIQYDQNQIICELFNQILTS